jgi:hypothetical protein
MTATGTPTTETLSSPPPVRPRHNAVTATAGLFVAAITLTPWLLDTGSQTQTGPIMPTSAAASPPQAAPALGQASAGSKARGSPGQRRTSCSARTARPCALSRRPHRPTPVTSSSAGTAPACALCRNATDRTRWTQGSKRGGPIPAPPLIPRPQHPGPSAAEVYR